MGHYDRRASLRNAQVVCILVKLRGSMVSILASCVFREDSRGFNMMILYIKPWCPWCIEAINYLDAHGFSYEKRDVLKDAAAYAQMEKISHQSLTPTLEIHGKVLADFDVQQLERFLAKEGIVP